MTVSFPAGLGMHYNDGTPQTKGTKQIFWTMDSSSRFS
jgi:hypothetical protein